MAPVWVTVATPVTPPKRLGPQRRGIPGNGRKENPPLDPATVRSIRAGRPGTKVMLKPPAFLTAIDGPLPVPTLDPNLESGGNRADMDNPHHSHGSLTEASELTARSLDNVSSLGGGDGAGGGGAGGRETKASAATAAPGQREALAFAMRGLKSDASETATESWKRSKPKKPGTEPTVIERMLQKKERREMAATFAADEAARRAAARAQAIADGHEFPGSPPEKSGHHAGGKVRPEPAAAAAAAAAAASAPEAAGAADGKAEGGGLRNNLIDLISRPGTFDKVLGKPPRPEPPRGPRQAAVGSNTVGGRVTLPSGRPTYALTTSSAFYERALAVATEHRGPDLAELARLEAAALAKEKAEAKKRQLDSAIKGVSAFMFRGYKSPEDIQREIAEEAAALREARKQLDPDYVRRKRKGERTKASKSASACSCLSPSFVSLFPSPPDLQLWPGPPTLHATHLLCRGGEGLGDGQGASLQVIDQAHLRQEGTRRDDGLHVRRPA